MGLIKKIVNLFSQKNYLLQVMEQSEKQMQTYLSMPCEELSALEDSELCSAVIYRLDERINRQFGQHREVPTADWVASLSSVQKVVYCMDWLEGSISLHGLREALYNKNEVSWASEFAPCVSQSLSAIGAEQHREQWNEFLLAQSIDLTALSYSKMPSPADDHGSYEAFDAEFSNLPSLEPLLASYIRSNIAEF